MSTDAIIFIGMIFAALVGYALGRWEKKDQQTRTYRHGYKIGKKVGESNARTSE